MYILVKTCILLQNIECPRLNVTNGRLLGNMHNNGSRKQVICNPDYIEVAGAIITTCIDGNWIPKPKCIVKRKDFINSVILV